MKIIIIFLNLRVSVRLGEWDISSEKDCQHQICSDAILDIEIKEIILHDDYVPDSVSHEHDIALILLEQSVKFTKWIKPICLPTSEEMKSKSYDGISIDVAGWGYTSSLPNGKKNNTFLLNFIKIQVS